MECLVYENEWCPVLRMWGKEKKKERFLCSREVTKFSLLVTLEGFAAQGQDFKVVH